METIIYSIDSKLIDKESASSFIYNLPEKIFNVVNINLSSIEIPNSVYVFNNTRDNNVFKINIRDTDYNFYLEQGNYTIEELYNEILFFFNNINISIWPPTDLHGGDSDVKLNFTYDSDNRKFKLECIEPFSLYFDNITEYYSMGRQLGFAQDKYENIFEIISEYIPDIGGDKYIFLKLNDYGNIYHNNNKYFSKIIINKESYEMIFNSQHKYVSKTFKFGQPIDLEKLNVKFEDYLGNLVNFNGLDVSFTLEIKYIKNLALKPFYQKYNYDEELMRMILTDSMMNFYLTDDYKLPMLEINSHRE